MSAIIVSKAHAEAIVSETPHPLLDEALASVRRQLAQDDLLATLEEVATWSHSGHGCFPVNRCGLCSPVLKAIARAKAGAK